MPGSGAIVTGKVFAGDLLIFALSKKVFIFIPVTTFTGLLLYSVFTGMWPKLYSLEKYIANPFYIIPFAVFMLFFWSIPEELGWRGFALDH